MGDDLPQEAGEGKAACDRRTYDPTYCATVLAPEHFPEEAQEEEEVLPGLACPRPARLGTEGAAEVLTFPGGPCLARAGTWVAEAGG